MIMYIDDNDNDKRSLVASFARSGANDDTRATNKQYALWKSSYCPNVICVL